MNKTEHEKIKRTISAWRNAMPRLERERRQAIRASDTARAILQLEDAFQSALLHHPPALSSGLVDQQRYFSRLKP